MSLFSRFRAGGAFLAFFEDDYFYYLRVARNIAAGHGSTYDGAHLTNGYHPLWMLVNVALARLFTGRAFFYALLSGIEGCVLATYWFLRLCFRRYADEALAAGLAGLVAVQGLELMVGGMEVVLTIPLFAILCWYRVCRFDWGARSVAVYGLLCAVLVLSRLDTALFVAFLVLFELLTWTGLPRPRKTRAALAFAAGLLPVAIYFAVNLAVFHTAMPVSGEAKQLRSSHIPSGLALHEALLEAWIPIRFSLNLPVFCAGLLAMFLLARSSGRLGKDRRALVWALLVFPYMDLLVLSVVSDWPIWPWYYYFFVAGAVGVCLVLLTYDFASIAVPKGRPMRLLAPAVLLGFFVLLGAFSAGEWRNAKRHNLPIYTMYDGAIEIRNFARTHPGVYGMGDRAGVVGALVNEPIVQLEGLMMDKAFLNNIRQQRELHGVLRRYGIRYYIVTNPTRIGNCYRAAEPMKAGPTSPTMQGTFCSKPLDRFQYGDYTTYIFDMNREIGADHQVGGNLQRPNRY